MSSFEWPPSGGGGGVTSLNTLTGDVILAGGTGITLTPVGNTITISSSDLAAAITSINGDTTTAQLIVPAATGTDFTVNTVSGTTTLAIPTASASNRGLLSSTDWSTFNSKQAALTEGNLTEATSSVLTITGGTSAVIGTGTSIQVKQSNTSTSGYLSSTDWNTFNSKQAAGNYALTDLSNLVTTTVANNSISPGTSNAIDLGAPTKLWRNIYFNTTIFADTSSTILYNGGRFFDLSGNTAIDLQNRRLENSSGTTLLAFSGASAVLTGSATTFTGNLTGDVTSVAMATTIASGTVTLAKMANLAANSIIGNNTGSGATPIALTVSQVNTLLGTVTSVGTFSSSSIANGASIASNAITLGVADGTNPGLVSTTTQTIAGIKNHTAAITVGGNTTSDSNYGTISSVQLSEKYSGSFGATYNQSGTPFASGQSQTITYEKVGKQVTLFFPALIAAAGSSSQPIRAAAATVPSNLAPASNFYSVSLGIEDNSTAQSTPGYVRIYSTGQIDIGKTYPGANFTGSGNCGFDAFAITYISAN